MGHDSVDSWAGENSKAVRDRGHRHSLCAAAGGAMSGKVHYTVSGHLLSRPRFAVNELCAFPSHS